MFNICFSYIYGTIEKDGHCLYHSYLAAARDVHYNLFESWQLRRDVARQIEEDPELQAFIADDGDDRGLGARVARVTNGIDQKVASYDAWGDELELTTLAKLKPLVEIEVMDARRPDERPEAPPAADGTPAGPVGGTHRDPCYSGREMRAGPPGWGQLRGWFRFFPCTLASKHLKTF